MHRSLSRWLRPAASDDTLQLQGAMAQRLAQLRPFPEPGEQLLATQPLLVFDLETSGLDLKHDQVLSGGAVHIENMAIILGKTYERILNVDTRLQADSQLFHGLTADDLRHGTDPRVALLELLEQGQNAIWLAWQGWFDQHMLHKGAQHWLGMTTAQLPQVVDLALIMPALFPALAQPNADLDDWLRYLGLSNAMRHHATADAMVTAELTLICLHQAQTQGLQTWKELAALATREKTMREQRGQALWHGF